jgi:uncharacterized protein (DUF2062 family)
MFLRKLNAKSLKKVWKEDVIAKHESAEVKALSVAVGLFFGIVPLWGFQFALAIITAVVFKLNKVIVGLTAQVSVPPMIPFILYASVKTGEFVLNQKVDLTFSKFLSLQTLTNLWVYGIGASVLAIIAALSGLIISWTLLKVFGYKANPND